MEHEAPSTDRSPFTRLEAVREEDCDVLADMFLGERIPARRIGSKPGPGVGSTLDLVIAGHLDDPEAAFERFCEHAASESGDPLGCVRHAGAGWVAWVHGRRVWLGDRRASISTAVADVARRCGRVVVLLPGQNEVGRLVAGLDGLSDPPDSIVVLSTARESDVVASYRQAKSVAALSPRQVGRLRFELFASDEPLASAALTRLVDTADRFLGLSIPGRVHVPAPVESADPLDTEDQLASPDPGTEGLPQGTSERQPATECREVSRGNPPADLISLVPGVEPLPSLTCPDAPGAVFGVDAGGSLHVVVGQFAADGPGPPALAPEKLLALGEAFASRHAPVLSSFDRRLRPGHPPVHTHLVSDRYATLAPLIGGRTRLHLAVAVAVDGVNHWGSTELAS